MQYANEDDICKEMIFRTKMLLMHESKYDVTLLINSFIGLLIIPKEKHRDLVNDSFIDGDILCEMKSFVNTTYSDGHTVEAYVRHLRNAVAHGKLRIIAEKPVLNDRAPEITSVEFKDKDRRTQEEFEAEIPVSLLRKFVIQFANSMYNAI